jgi:predicted transposase/invertase (TIGR01784 family)
VIIKNYSTWYKNYFEKEEILFMSDVVNPHDKFFKEVFSHKDGARDFFAHYLPGDILKLLDLSEIEIVKESFIEKELKEYFSDILYKVSLADSPAYLYILFEHKSYPDRLTALQVLEYMVKIWRLHLNQNPPSEGLPLIIPLVVYHGVKPWRYGTKLSDMLSGPAEPLAPYVPDFQFLLYDLSRYGDEEIKGMIVSRAGLLVMKHIFHDDLPDVLEEVMELLSELSDKTRALDYVETIIRYVINASDVVSLNDLKTIIEESYFQKKEGELMTIAEQLRREGHQKGLEQGLQKGREQGLEQGLEQGQLEDARDSILDNLEVRFGIVPQDIVKELKSIDEIAVLRQLRKKAIVVEGIEEFREMVRKAAGLSPGAA